MTIGDKDYLSPSDIHLRDYIDIRYYTITLEEKDIEDPYVLDFDPDDINYDYHLRGGYVDGDKVFILE
ncbi:hypothetical protein [Halalkalibacter hemicellulosilyticus]|uniref:Uncharacterized protein n=1 Tax=Halalkalibacter hemicellulosilyticusJCM 9152 TaxID=1236971 RepID=W4QL35_9BACI|nr:hypothetical protein [Halalkalibacter hemicellulosilyticus]GAE32830.1 hypothetical protein JCM9152_4412 [Halalkalibacter hemicellulosilyticusJCM 9152]